jgi:aminopeptidase N
MTKFSPRIFLALLLLAALMLSQPALAQETKIGGQSIGDPYAPELGNTGYDVTHYDLDLKFDFEAVTLTGIATIDATATLDGMSRLSLDFGKMKTSAVQVDGKDAKFEQKDDVLKLFVDLPQPVAKDQKFTLKISYAGKPTTINSSYLGFLPTGLYMYEKQRQVFAINEPDAARTWFPGNDHPRDRATYTFHLTVPGDLMGVANGTQQGDPTTNTDGTKTYTWDMPNEMSSYLATVAVADYVRVPLDDAGTGVPLAVYVYKKDATAAAKAFSEMGKIIKLEIDKFGPYPFKTYSMVLVNQRSVGLEAQTMTVLPDVIANAEPAQIRQLIDHELAHQWFGDAVSLDTWGDIWLNESFASYAEYLTTEGMGAPGATLRTLIGWENATRFNVGQSPIVNPVRAQMFGSNSYVKGGFVLNMLRREVGDEAFFKILKQWVARYGGKTAKTSDFIALANEISGKDLKEFFDKWLYRDDIPTASIKWVQNGDSVEALVCQSTKQPFKASIPVVLTDGKDNGKSVKQTLTLGDQAQATVTFKADFPVQTWQIDPDNVILATVNASQVNTLPTACAK